MVVLKNQDKPDRIRNLLIDAKDYKNAYYHVAQSYDPTINNGSPFFGRFTKEDADKAITYYDLFLSEGKNQKDYLKQYISALGQLGLLYYKRKSYVRSLACFKIAYLNDDDFRKSYDTLKGWVRQEAGEIWIGPMTSIFKYDQIEPTISRVNAEIDARNEARKRAAENAPKGPTCPQCGSTAITAGARGVNGFWGFVGASKTVNRCASCGYTWDPSK